MTAYEVRISDWSSDVCSSDLSAVKPPGTSRWSSVYPRGTSLVGSTGRSASSGTSGSSWTGCPSSSSRYQTGTGTPQNRCRRLSQDRQRVVSGKSAAVRLDFGGGRIINKKQQKRKSIRK